MILFEIHLSICYRKAGVPVCVMYNVTILISMIVLPLTATGFMWKKAVLVLGCLGKKSNAKRYAIFKARLQKAIDGMWSWMKNICTCMIHWFGCQNSADGLGEVEIVENGVRMTTQIDGVRFLWKQCMFIYFPKKYHLRSLRSD